MKLHQILNLPQLKLRPAYKRIALCLLVCAAVVTGAVFTFTKPTPKLVKGVLIPHHLLAVDLIYAALDEVNFEPQHIILLAPNHLEAGNQPVSTDPNIIANEHSVTDLIPIFEQYFPQAQISPLIFSNFTKTTIIADLIVSLEPRAQQKDTLVVGTVDFAHYVPANIADKNDAQTLGLIKSRQYQALRNLTSTHVDSPATLVAFFSLMDSLQSPCIMKTHQNSARIAKVTNHNTTSYFTFICR